MRARIHQRRFWRWCCGHARILRAPQGFGLDGRVVYAKYGGGGVCIEHIGRCWQIKRVEDRGTTACMASVAGGCALVDCVARVWARASSNGPTDDIHMKLSTGDDADQKVSGCRVSPALACYLTCGRSF
jgi:hypothetical protein